MGEKPHDHAPDTRPVDLPLRPFSPHLLGPRRLALGSPRASKREPLRPTQKPETRNQKPMKIQTKLNDLVTLIASNDATTKAQHDAERLTVACSVGSRESAISALDISLASRGSASKALATFAKLPGARRDLATATKAKAETLGGRAVKFGGKYSGETARAVRWTAFPFPKAETSTEKGHQYSRGCSYRKTDASHVVALSPEWAVLLAEREDVATLSERDGLPLIGWHADGRACWVKTKRGAITSETGWIAHFGATCYHSTTSQRAAEHGLAKKLASQRAFWASAAEARKNAAQYAKDERRARLVARLCDVDATIADARAMGYCLPGIEAFQSHHQIGDSAPLRALLASGNPSAVRLALAVARKVRRAEPLAA